MESDILEGKVGRIYMPKQAIDTIPQHKMKVLSTPSDLCNSSLEARPMLAVIHPFFQNEFVRCKASYKWPSCSYLCHQQCILIAEMSWKSVQGLKRDRKAEPQSEKGSAKKAKA